MKEQTPKLEEGPESTRRIISNSIQGECGTKQPGWGRSLVGQGEPSQEMQQRWEAQWQEFLKTLQPICTRWQTPIMPEMAPWEDAKAFLASFEQVAKACQWPREEWVARLLPALSGEAEEAFQTLETGDQEDYRKVKATILRRDALRMERQRQHFRQFYCQEIGDPRRIYNQLQELCHRWLKPERRSKEQILELLILEQFLASLPPDLQSWIRARGPDSCSQAMALMEDFLTVQKDAERDKWQGQLKEECLVSAEAEEEETSDVMKGELFKETQQNGDGELNVPGNGMKCSAASLPLKGLEMVQTGVQKMGDTMGVMNLKETVLSLPVFSQPLTQPSQQTIVWNVLQKEAGNADSLDADSGRQIKMENSPWRGNETTDIAKTALLINQGNIQGAMETHDEGCEFKEEQRKHLMRTEDESNKCTEGLKAVIEYPFKKNTRDKMPMFSQCGRRYSLELDVMHTMEDHKEYLMSEESCEQNSYLGEPLRTIITGDNNSEFLEKEENNLNTDQNNHPEETLDKSPESGKNFSFTNLPKKNLGIQSEGRLYNCSQCGKCFLQRRNLMIHQRSHVGVIPYKCFQCGKCFSQQRNLTVHQRTHIGGKPYKCFQCGKCFSLGKYLKRHEGIHTGVKMKPYKCSHCEKCFNQGKELTIHQRIHTGEKPYKCSQCGKCFNQQGNLRNHWRIHTGEKPYKCPVCGKSFGRSNQLKTHQGIHTGEKPYKCSQCGKCFKVEKYLKRHERIHTDQMKALDVRNDAIRELT